MPLLVRAVCKSYALCIAWRNPNMKTFIQISCKYENFIAIGDFNDEMTNIYLEKLCVSYNLKNLIKQPTCFKTLENPTRIDHVLTNHQKRFHLSSAFQASININRFKKFFMQSIILK